MKILLITGHGNGDPGACACGYQEADLVREIAPILKSKLSTYADVDIFDMSKNMYRYLKSNSFNFKNYDYVFELHFNAAANDTSGNGVTTGTEILVHPNESGVSVEKAILENICALGFRNRGVKVRSNLQNMNICKGSQGVSYALLETCFIDDADDMRLYQGQKDAVISAIANGIISGFGLGAPASIATVLNDISGHYAEQHIKKLLGYGAVSGYGDMTFRPDNSITRAEFATMIVNALEKACGYTLQMSAAFSDITGHWAETQIQKLVACGIVNGFTDGTFKPDDLITRGQAAIMAANFLYYCGVKGKDYSKPFPDTAGHYADDHIQTLQHYGIVNGYEDGEFKPDKEISRGQSAMYVANCLTVLGQ